MFDKLNPKNWWKKDNDENETKKEWEEEWEKDNISKAIEEIEQLEEKSSETKTQSISEDIKNNVDKILVASDKDKLRYFLKDFFRKETWNEVSVVDSYNWVQVNTWLLVSNNKSIESIIIDMLWEESVELKGKSIIIWNLELDINIYSEINLSIRSSKIKDNDLKLLKEILQKHLIKNVASKNEALSWDNIVDILWLERKNLIFSEKNSFTIALWLEWKIDINSQSLVEMMLSQDSFTDNYFIKIWNKYLSWNSISVNVTSNNKDFWYYNVEIENRNDDLIIKVSSNNSLISEEIVSKFIKPLIYKILKLQDTWETSIKKLESLWVKVNIYSNEELSIDQICEQEWFVWYEDIKDEVDTKILSPWRQKDKYQSISKEIFPNIKSIIPNYVIFEWEPWTWKTTKWKIIGRYLWYPFIYIPINSITSKWYWESESRLNEIFELAWKIWEEYWWAVVMIDEIDEIWGNRDNSYEATARVTWVLLKKLDWVEKIDDILLVASTNRLNKLDPALISRSNLNLNFRRPNRDEINLILNHYINWLWAISDDILDKLEWKSWRDLSNLAKDFVSHIIKNFEKEQIEEKSLFISEFKKFIEKRD